MIMHELKASTRSIHEKLEKMWFVPELLSDPKISTYEFVLKRWYGMYRGYQLFLNENLSNLAKSWEARLHNIESDLKGLRISACQIEPLNFSDSSADYPYGVVYVLEGSTLGGKVIASQLQCSQKQIIRQNIRFLKELKISASQRWKLLQQNFLEIEEESEQVIQTAITTFHTIQQWFEDPMQ